MKVMTLDEVIQGNVSSDASCLYLVREASIVFYIGQSSDPVERLRQHIGIASPEHQTRLGRLIMSNAPRSKAWQVALWTLADCAPYVGLLTMGLMKLSMRSLLTFPPA